MGKTRCGFATGHTIEAQETAGIQCIGPSSKQETNSGSNTIEYRADDEKSSSRSTSQESNISIRSDSLVNLTGTSQPAERIVHLMLLSIHWIGRIAFAKLTPGQQKHMKLIKMI